MYFISIIFQTCFEAREFERALWLVGYEKPPAPAEETGEGDANGNSNQDDEDAGEEDDDFGDHDSDDEAVVHKNKLMEMSPPGCRSEGQIFSVLDPNPGPLETLPHGYTITNIGQ